jgi:predicted dehydrogenase
MRKVRAGIIGLGVGEQHIAGYHRHPACEVVALCDVAPEKRAMAARKYPGLRVTADDREVLEDPGIDVVSVATFDDAHARQVLGALAHGKHVFVEKPLCLHEEELGAIRAALRGRPGLHLSSNLILRRCPRFIRLRQMIRAGELGELFYLEGDYNYGRLHKIVEGWRGRLPFYSVVHGGAIHLIDLLRWLTGERIVEVTARGNHIASRGSPFRNHDLVVALCRFEGGALAKVGANFGCVHPHFHAVNVYGTRATFQNGWPDARLFRSPDPSRPPEVITTEYPGAHKGDLLFSLVEAIVAGGQPEVSAADVLDTMAASLAIERASHQPGPVAVR